MMRAGIFGGSFNPVHNGHLALARSLLHAAGLDEIWFMVSPQNPLKRQDSLLDDGKRLEMVRLALAGEPRLKACDYEFRLPRPSYTWNTLQSLSRDFPGVEFTLLIGGDNWAGFGRWFRHDDILASYRIAVYPRRGACASDMRVPPGVQVLDTPLIDISSTEIRRRIRAGLPVDSLVPPAVAAKIAAERLYL